MAALGNEIRMCTVNPTEFLGLSEGQVDSEVIVSGTNTSVTVYRITDRKAVKSFNTWRSQTLLTSAIYSSKQRRYVGALRNCGLRIWTEDDTNICKGEKIKVSHEIDSLWSAGAHLDPLIIYKNGAVHQLTNSNETNVIFKPIDDAAQVSFVDVLQNDDMIHVAFILTTEQNDVSCHHFVFVQNETYKLREQFVGFVPMPTLIGLCLMCSPDDGRVNLLLLGSDGKLHIGIDETSSGGIKWNCRQLTNSFDESTCTVMVPLKSHIVIALQEKEGDINCTVYNVKYGAPTHKNVVKGDRNLTLLRFYKAHNNLFLLAGEDLYLVPYSYESIELAHVLGSRPNVRSDCNKEIRAQRNLTWTTTGLKEETAHGERIASEKAHFSKAFVKLVEEIESGGAADQEACSLIFNELVKANKFELLGEALTYYKNIPEMVLVNVLASYLSYEDKQSQLLQYYKDKSGIHEAQLLPLVDQILATPINDVFLQEHIRKLPFDHVVFLLHYLHSFLKCFRHLEETDWRKVTKFVEWISILVDAHFHYLIVAKNEAVHHFLHELQSTVVNQCEILECLTKIQELIWIAKSREKLIVSKTNKGYGIETLHFI